MGRLIMVLGGILMVVGAIMHFTPGLLHWFGRLPGDIRIENEHTTLFVPMTSMIIVSIALTILINLFRRWM